MYFDHEESSMSEDQQLLMRLVSFPDKVTFTTALIT